MPASLELLPRKEFILTLSDGSTIPGKFGTWALKRFGDKRNMGLAQLAEAFVKQRKNVDGSPMFQKNEKDEDVPVYDISMNDMIDYIICACEYKARLSNEKTFTFNEVTFCNWVDDYTMDTNEDGVIMKLYSHATSSEKKSNDNPPADN